MDTIIKNKYSVIELCSMLKNAKDIEEIHSIEKLIPALSPEEQREAHMRLDDGIYDQFGTLIGEKHPED